MGTKELHRSELIEVAHIFRDHGRDYAIKNCGLMSPEQLKALNAITICRTAQMGGHIDKCDNCDAERISYNSCRNRNCPKCQCLKKEKWILERGKDLLPIPYFHIVFTLPSELNDLIWRNKKDLFNIFFQSVSETLLQTSSQKKHLGAQIGFISLLHTWGQTLTQHPHIHCIVTGGGLSNDEKTWISSRDSYFIPVKVLSRLFRGKFLGALKKLNAREKIKFTGKCKPLAGPDTFRKFIDGLYKKKWVVYCKEPFSNPDNLLRYLGRYTHRVALTNNRILDYSAEGVLLQYKDYRNQGQIRLLKLGHHEFIRRFLLHSLPRGFVKIRHYGILANRKRQRVIEICKKILKPNISKQSNIPKDWKELLKVVTGLDVSQCQNCEIGMMFHFRKLHPLPQPP